MSQTSFQGGAPPPSGSSIIAGAEGYPTIADGTTITGNGTAEHPLAAAPLQSLATVTVRLYDNTTGDTIGGAQRTILANGSSGSVSLVTFLNNVPDDASEVTLEIKTTAGTVRIRPQTHPDSESAAVIVQNTDGSSFLGNYGTELSEDFSTSSTTFTTVLAVDFTPGAGSDLQFVAAVNFDWIA